MFVDIKSYHKTTLFLCRNILRWFALLSLVDGFHMPKVKIVKNLSPVSGAGIAQSVEHLLAWSHIVSGGTIGLG